MDKITLFVHEHRAKWKMPKPIRWLGIQFFYYAGVVSLWIFERTFVGPEDVEPEDDYFWTNWFSASYQYCMALSSDLDIYNWIWKGNVDRIDLCE